MHALHLVLVSSLVAAACQGDSVTSVGESNPPASPPPPTAPKPPPPTAPTPIPIGLTITGPTDVMVHQSALYRASVELRIGDTTTIHDTTVTWTTSDSAVARSDGGVLFAVARGSTVVTARFDSLETSVTVRVRARLRIGPDAIGPIDHLSVTTLTSKLWTTVPAWSLSQGDTLRLGAVYVDVNGEAIEEAPLVTWTSLDAQVASVSTGALVSGQLPGSTTIKADSDDGSDVFAIEVLPLVRGDTAGLATVRLADAVRGVDSLTLRLSTGIQVSLSTGSSAVMEVHPGTFLARAGSGYTDSSSNRTFGAELRAGDDLTIYMVGDGNIGFLKAGWSYGGSVAPDSGRIRLIQGSDWPVVYLLPPGASPGRIPQLCYFDSGDVSWYFTVPAGSRDLLLASKYQAAGPSARFPVTAPSGRSVTYVLYGTMSGTSGVVAFLDP